jgi:hypothetical protein
MTPYVTLCKHDEDNLVTVAGHSELRFLGAYHWRFTLHQVLVSERSNAGSFTSLQMQQ